MREPGARAEIIRRREAFTGDAAAMASEWAGQQAALRDAVRRGGGASRRRLPDELYAAIARLVVNSGVASHRADVTSSSARRRWPRSPAARGDGGRRRRGRRRSRSATGSPSTRSRRRRASTAGAPPACSTRRSRREVEAKKARERGDVGGDLVADLDVPPAVASLQVDPDEVFAKRTPRDRSSGRGRAGGRARSSRRRRASTRATGSRRRDDTDIAFDATMRAAAVAAGADRVAAGGPPPQGSPSPLAVRRLLRPRQQLVDPRRAHGREGEGPRLPAARGRDRQRRPRRARRLPGRRPRGDGRAAADAQPAARVPPAARGAALGQTPLADALRRARILLRQELSKHPNAVPLVVAVTDGLATGRCGRTATPSPTRWPRPGRCGGRACRSSSPTPGRRVAPPRSPRPPAACGCRPSSSRPTCCSRRWSK